MRRGLVIAAALLAGCGTRTDELSVQRVAPGATPLEQAAATIRPIDFKARIGFLASDALRGRDTPSQGLDAAAEYIASEFTALALRPAGDGASFIQRYPFPLRTFSADSVRLELRSPTQTVTLAAGRDFYVLPGRPDRFQGGMVFIGPTLGVTGELRDRIAVLDLRNVRGAAIDSVRDVARAAGATGVIGILGDEVGPETVATLTRASGPLPNTTRPLSIPLLAVTKSAIAPVLRGAGLNIDSLLATAPVRDSAPVAVPGVIASFAAPVREVDRRPPNVIAVLEGSDAELRDTYVVFSAHMDHIGVLPPNARGDSIANGADDDASGTSAIIELAQAFAALPVRPARSLLFLAVSGEEKGLLGSQYFVDHPPIPISRIVADINIDMIGRNWPDTVVAIGQGYSSLGPTAQRVAREHPELNVTLIDDPWPEERFFFRSDHFNFAAKEVPAIFFFSGVHEDYHQVTDEVSRIDTEKTARITRLIFYLGHAIANDRDPPRWTDAGLREVRQLVSGGRR